MSYSWLFMGYFSSVQDLDQFIQDAKRAIFRNERRLQALITIDPEWHRPDMVERIWAFRTHIQHLDMNWTELNRAHACIHNSRTQCMWTYFCAFISQQWWLDSALIPLFVNKEKSFLSPPVFVNDLAFHWTSYSVTRVTSLSLGNTVSRK